MVYNLYPYYSLVSQIMPKSAKLIFLTIFVLNKKYLIKIHKQGYLMKDKKNYAFIKHLSKHLI